jgi:hypothetical protein
MGAQEGQQSQVPVAFLERITHDLHEYVQGCVAELVFNLSEVAISDSEDCKTKTVIVLAAMFWSDDTSRSISKCETYFGDSLPVSCWIITSPRYSHIAKFPNSPRASQKSKEFVAAGISS